MKNSIYKILLFSSLLFILSCANNTISPIWELPDPDLKEIATIRVDPNFGHVVIYNPDTCIEIGDACMFFRRQAYAHSHLRHVILAEPDDYPLSQVASADCWAAKYGKPNEVNAVVALLLNEKRDPNLKIYGNPIERAERIQACAFEKGDY